MRFSRSTNDVFSFEESSESRSVYTNRHARADQCSSLDLDDAIVPTRLDHLAVETDWPKDATDNFSVKVESVRGDQRDTFKVHSAGYVLKVGERVLVASSPYGSRRLEPGPEDNRGEDPDRMFFVANGRANLVCLTLLDDEGSYSSIVEPTARVGCLFVRAERLLTNPAQISTTLPGVGLVEAMEDDATGTGIPRQTVLPSSIVAGMHLKML